MKYTCTRCGVYTTNLKSNLKRHLNRKRKCPQIIRNMPENESKRHTIGTQKDDIGTKRHTKRPFRHTKGTQKAHKGTQKPVLNRENPLLNSEIPVLNNINSVLNSEIPVLNNTNEHFEQECNENQERNMESETKIESEPEYVECKTADNKWICLYCKKTFKHNRSWNRHMRSYCKGKSNKTQLLEEENAALRKIIETGVITNNNNNTTTHNNTTNNNTTNYNTTNNFINNVTLPEGQWSRMLYRMMVLLMSKTKGDRFQAGELEFPDAFQKTMSLAFFHPDSPIYESVQLLGRKESWAKQNGDIVGKKKLIKNINKEHYERLLLFMKADNERFRKELPPAPVIEKWIEVNNEVISHIHKYDPCEKEILRNTEEILRNRKLPSNYTTLISEVKESDRMDRLIAKSQMP